MGIKYFQKFLGDNFEKHIYKMRRGEKVSDIKQVNVVIDNLMIDMNGVFHNSAQKIYEYGNYKPEPSYDNRLLKKQKYVVQQPRKKSAFKLQQDVFSDICSTVEKLVNVANPTKRLILCVDGPAPLAKQLQQRQRRFRSARDSGDDSPFETSSITPGTKFMDYLSKYIDWYIRKRITEDPKWKKLEIVFSNEKVSGEGEHKLINFIRYHGTPDESYCINGLDADLVMLALGTHMPTFYILRDELYDSGVDYRFINVSLIRHDLVELMRWESDKYKFDDISVINDFIFLGFMVGNDFLPHIPSIEIIEEGIELMIDVYKEQGPSYGHITNRSTGRVQFIKETLEIFLMTLGNHEKENFEHKLGSHNYNSHDPDYQDFMLEDCGNKINGRWHIDIEKYNDIYHNEKFQGTSIKKICHEYFEGMQWVLSYYTQGVPNWQWLFPYHYAPSASILCKHLHDFKFPHYGRTQPTTPFQQLLCVLPPKCANLIPAPLDSLLLEGSPLTKYCPVDFEVDLAGKKKDWEGIVLVGHMDFEAMSHEYYKHLGDVSSADLKRNKAGNSFVYIYDEDNKMLFQSYYGDIADCTVRTIKIDI